MRKLEFAVLALAVWRISNMLVKEDGPWMVFEHLRLKLGVQPPQPPSMVRETDPPGKMPGSLFTCVWCMSIWVGSAFALLFVLSRKVGYWLSIPFALSAISCVIDRWDSWSDR